MSSRDGAAFLFEPRRARRKCSGDLRDTRMAKNGRPFLSLLLLSTAMLFTVSARAADETALPRLAQCSDMAHPRLPEKWRGSFLMAPFTNAQLVLAEIVSDASLAATRARLFGLKGGTADLLVAGSTTYLVEDEHDGTTCTPLGDTGLRPLPQDWLSDQSQCAGSAPVGETATDWWKTPVAPAPASDWIWFNQQDRAPLRLVFQTPSDRLGILGRFAQSHRLRFEPLLESGLGRIVETCQATASAIHQDAARRLSARLDALAKAPRNDRELAGLAPELSACPKAPLPRWPRRLVMTGLMTPFDFNEDPHPTEVLYDWARRAQRTRVFFSPKSGATMQDALLVGERGDTVTHRRGRAPTCASILPGAVRPDWPAHGPCNCEAMVADGTPLTPYGAARVLSCPLASPRAAWAWYAESGRPMSFMVTSLPGDQGIGLFAVLDYRDWRPGQVVDGRAFARPLQCRASPARVDQTGSTMPDRPEGQCSTCHLGR